MLPRHFLTLIFGASLGFLVALTHGVLADKNDDEKIVKSSISLPVEELRSFTEVFTRIKQDYVETVDDKTLIEYAIKGMLSGLDPHSAYLPPDDYKELQVGTSGQFGGLGIEVNMEDGFVKVISPIDDTPAQRAGILAGDLIVRLDETPVKGLTLGDAVKIMRGKPGEPIVLTVIRKNEDKPLTIEIIRDIIKVKSVRSRSLEDGFGYVRISQFQSRTTADFRKAISEFKKEYKGKFKGLVLDLRNNPGGVLNAAVGVSDTFIKQGLIVYTEGRIQDARLKFTANNNDMIDGTPIVVLVNSGSASASEIVAGALQDHKRAIIMGTKTFGKGSVQTIQGMINNAALKLTTARYFTPNGRSIQAEGILPDINLENIQLTKVEKDSSRSRITEADLKGHLDNPTDAKNKDKKDGKDKDKSSKTDKKSDTDKNNDKDNTDKEANKDKPFDYALHEALNLLKGIHILNTDS